VRDLFVEGRAVVQGSRMATLDEVGLAARAGVLARRLAERA
jgi:hypothetical protein